MTDKELFEKRLLEINQALKDDICDFPFQLDHNERAYLASGSTIFTSLGIGDDG